MKQILKFILFLVIITTLSNFITLIVMKIFYKKEYYCVKFKYNEKYISQSDIYKEKEDKKEENTNKYKGFKDFQMIMVVPIGNEKKCQQIIDELAPITGDMKGWRFVFSTPEKIQAFYDSYKLMGQLDGNKGTPAVIIVDKELNHRGRKGKNKKGEEEYKESYNTISAADLHNEMTDDVKIILREYRLALKKNQNARKDAFRDNIKENIEKQK
jgi:hypothetical protein